MTTLLNSNFNLKFHNSFIMDSYAEYFANPTSMADLIRVLDFAEQQNLAILPLGEGSNSLLDKDIAGLVLKLGMADLQIFDDMPEYQIWRIEAGYNWHKLVMQSVEQNLYGLERLALIPGSVGAAPVQNIGAYGSEVKDALLMVEVLDKNLRVKTIENVDCEFAYRNSIFKQNRDYLILAIYVKLAKKPLAFMADYSNLNINSSMTSLEIAEQIIKVRQAKLPDYKQYPNVGSFFKNPVISLEHFAKLRETYVNIPSFSVEAGVKIPAAWLIEQCGYKSKRIGNLGMYKNQPLVMVKYGDADLTAVFALAAQIQQDIQNKFGINLEIEAQKLSPIFV